MKLLPVFIVGLVLGLAAGLVFTWVIAPVEYINTFPSFLAASYRQDWIRMTALAYGLEGNLDRTHLRLQGLPEEDIHFVLLQTLEQAVTSSSDLESLRPIAELAAMYGVDSPIVKVYTEQEIVSPEMLVVAQTPAATSPPPAPTATMQPPTPMPTPPPDDIASALLQVPFTVISHTLACSDSPTIAVLLELTSTLGIEYAADVSRTLGISPTRLLTPTTALTATLDLTSTLDITATLDLSRTLELTNTLVVEEETPEPELHTRNWGRQIWLLWDDGADRAFTGFRPAYGQGYADFTVIPGRTYNLYIDNPWGVPFMVLQVEPCTPQEGEGWISRKLVIVEGLEKP
ncbi:MAG: hypothetical protein P1S60_00165 [Anaerolineae bacterium]|nr:hypothetical protein [Anaerolineae bacterium]